MIERLNKLKEVLEELKSDSFSEQYGFADFVESSEVAMNEMNTLASESSFYQKVLKEVDTMLSV